MNEDEVIALMETSKSAQEWDNNCDKIKKACSGYPAFWWETIIQSGRARRIMAKFGESPDIKIFTGGGEA